jgi:hypothetical protein
MWRATGLVLAVPVTLCGAAAARTAPAEAGTSRDVDTVVRCPTCRYPCAKGTVNCWACGMHIPGARAAKELAPVQLFQMSHQKPDPASAARMAAIPPEIRLEEIDTWFDENPEEFDEVSRRLDALLQEVRGTGSLEATVTARIRHVADAKAEATRPRTPQEREEEAAEALIEVMQEVRTSGNPRRNIKRLEAVLRKARGTIWETKVRALLKSEEAKLR